MNSSAWRQSGEDDVISDSIRLRGGKLGLRKAVAERAALAAATQDESLVDMPNVPNHILLALVEQFNLMMKKPWKLSAGES